MAILILFTFLIVSCIGVAVVSTMLYHEQNKHNNDGTYNGFFYLYFGLINEFKHSLFNIQKKLYTRYNSSLNSSFGLQCKFALVFFYLIYTVELKIEIFLFLYQIHCYWINRILFFLFHKITFLWKKNMDTKCISFFIDTLQMVQFINLIK